MIIRRLYILAGIQRPVDALHPVAHLLDALHPAAVYITLICWVYYTILLGISQPDNRQLSSLWAERAEETIRHAHRGCRGLPDFSAERKGWGMRGMKG